MKSALKVWILTMILPATAAFAHGDSTGLPGDRFHLQIAGSPARGPFRAYQTSLINFVQPADLVYDSMSFKHRGTNVEIQLQMNGESIFAFGDGIVVRDHRVYFVSARPIGNEYQDFAFELGVMDGRDDVILNHEFQKTYTPAEHPLIQIPFIGVRDEPAWYHLKINVRPSELMLIPEHGRH